MVRPFAALWRALTRFEAGKIAPEIAVRNTIGFIAAVVLATVFSSPSAGVLAGIGALNVSYSDSREPYIIRARRMFLSGVLSGIAVTLGALSANSNPGAVALATLWAFAAGMLVALGTQAGDLGVISLVTVVVFAARPLAPLAALESGLLAFAGGMLQMLLAIALWPIRRYEPERRILNSLYRDLAAIARANLSASKAPPVSSQITEAEDALASLTRDHSPEAERQIFLLNQAVRIRLSILNLKRLTRRIERRGAHSDAASAITRILEAGAEAIEQRSPESLERFHLAAHEFQAREWPADTSFFTALIRDASQEIDALAGQIRSVTRATTEPSIPRDQPAVPWRLRFTGRLARLEANLSLHSTVFRHAVRLAVCLGVGDALGRALTLERTYWIPMTIAIVLKPDFTATFSRGLLRILGTFAGLILATVLFHFIHTGVVTDIALMAVFTFLLRWIGPANYGIFVTALSSMIVLLIATTGVSPREVINARALNTAAGGALAHVCLRHLAHLGTHPNRPHSGRPARLLPRIFPRRDRRLLRRSPHRNRPRPRPWTPRPLRCRSLCRPPCGRARRYPGPPQHL